MSEIIIPAGAKTAPPNRARSQRVQSQDNGFYQNPSFFGYGGAGFGGSGGGVRNNMSGLGGSADKSEGTYFYPTIFNSRHKLETIYVESWAASKFVDMPIDDMFIKGREFEEEDEEIVDMMDEIDERFGVMSSLSRAMKGARLYGTAFIVIMTKDDPRMELDIERTQLDDLKSLLVFDRYDANVREWYVNPMHHKYGQPSVYEFAPAIQESHIDIVAHESRCIRFNGRMPISCNGWESGYDRDWGVSELLYGLVDIAHDSAFIQAIAHLGQEASIPTIKVTALKDAMSGTTAPDEQSIDEIGRNINLHKSIWNTLFLDKDDDFERATVNFTNMADIVDRFALRLAGIADIPATRFLGRSPAGLNSTGESDMDNYAIHVAALQERMLRRPLKKLDRISSLSAGIKDLPKSKFRPLTEFSDMDKATVNKSNVESIVAAAGAGAIEENEMREALSDAVTELFGDLPQWTEEKLAEMRGPDPMEMMEAESEIRIKEEKAKPSPSPAK